MLHLVPTYHHSLVSCSRALLAVPLTHGDRCRTSTLPSPFRTPLTFCLHTFLLFLVTTFSFLNCCCLAYSPTAPTVTYRHRIHCLRFSPAYSEPLDGFPIIGYTTPPFYFLFPVHPYRVFYHTSSRLRGRTGPCLILV